MKLNTKLVMMMLTLLIIATLILFVMNQFSQNDLVQEMQESSTEVSKAIQLSVEDLTSEEDYESSRLKDYFQQAKNKGINEINIISNEGEIINSSDPKQVGKRREIKKLEKGLKASQKTKFAGVSPSLHPYDLVVPVIVGDEQLGYVQINLLLDNISNIQHANFIRRLVATSTVFALGILLTFFLAEKIIQPPSTGWQRVLKRCRPVTCRSLFQSTVRTRSVNWRRVSMRWWKSFREREHLEKRLYQAEHLSRVGQLASGIAHEIETLSTISALPSIISRASSSPSARSVSSELESITTNIKEEVRKANYMVLNFMNYGRPLKLRLNEVHYSRPDRQGTPPVAGQA